MTQAVLQLLMGALAIGLSPIFVKLLMASTSVGPIAAGFWRMAIGALGFWISITFAKDRRQAFGSVIDTARSGGGLLLFAGVLFAFDLASWHTSFGHTSIAASTLIANMSSIFVPLAGVVFFKEKFSKKIAIGGVVAMIGVAGLTIFKTTGIRDESYDSFLLGEGLAFATAFFYTGYMLAIKKLAKSFSSRSIMFTSSAISAVILFGLALLFSEKIIPETMAGWVSILAVGLVSQFMGQGLIAKALSVLPVSQSALILLSAPTSSAIFGWLFLGESLAGAQMVSVVVTILGIGIVAMR